MPPISFTLRKPLFLLEPLDVQQYDRARELVLLVSRVPAGYMILDAFVLEAIRAEQHVVMQPPGPIVGDAVGKVLRLVQQGASEAHDIICGLQLAEACSGLFSVCSSFRPKAERFETR